VDTDDSSKHLQYILDGKNLEELCLDWQWAERPGFDSL